MAKMNLCLRMMKGIKACCNCCIQNNGEEEDINRGDKHTINLKLNIIIVTYLDIMLLNIDELTSLEEHPTLKRGAVQSTLFYF